MKKYVVFLISFVLSYLAYQIFAGWILTALYTPDFSLMSTSSQEVLFVGQNLIFPLLSAISIATLAYFLSEFIYKKTSRKQHSKRGNV